jgi:ABC-type transport system involved in multi-copper enzyme maturation permease subunit
MTTITATHPRAGTRSTVDGRVTMARVVAAELVKLRSIRSVIYALAAAALSLVVSGVGAAVGYVLSAGAPEEGFPDADPLGGALTGVTFTAYILAAVGVLAATGEYSGGTIRTTLAAVPMRANLVLAKAIAVATVVFTVAAVSMLVTFLAAQQILAGSDFAVSWMAPGVLRVLVGAALYLTVVALLGLGSGVLLRSTAGAVAVVVSVLILPQLFALLLPASVADSVVPLMPDPAGQAVMNLTQDASIAPWSGFAVFVGYAAVTLVAATLIFRHRDA